MVAVLDSGWDRIVTSLKEKLIVTFLKGCGFILLPALLSVPVVFFEAVLGGESQISSVLSKLIVFIMLMVPNLFTIEDWIAMVLLVWVFYIFRENRKLQFLSLIVVSCMIFYSEPSSIQWMIVFSIIPMYFYNGEKGRGDKNFFYIFYSVHIYFLYIVASLLH